MIYFAKKGHFMNKLILLLIPIFIITIAGCGSSNFSSPTAGGETITWTPPTSNVDGSPLTDLAGYKVYYGPASGNYTGGSTNVGLTTSYNTNTLTAGYYCFVVVSYDFSGNESGYSGELCKDIT